MVSMRSMVGFGICLVHFRIVLGSSVKSENPACGVSRVSFGRVLNYNFGNHHDFSIRVVWCANNSHLSDHLSSLSSIHLELGCPATLGR